MSTQSMSNFDKELQSEAEAIARGGMNIVSTLASMKIAITMFSLSILLILAGTLAQTEKDIWEVVAQYFRCWFAWIEFKVFFPPAWFPEVNREFIGLKLGSLKLSGFWFPGGWLIGSVMAINLLAAHSVKFKMQAKGVQLIAGVIVTVVGMILTWLVIEAGNNVEGTVNNTGLSWNYIWTIFRATLLGFAFLCMIWGSYLDKKKVREFYGLFGLALAMGITASVLFALGDRAQLDPSGMRILWQLLKATFAGIILLAGCYLLFEKRAGIVLLHAGILLMMGNEIIVASFHQEAQMRLIEGEYRNYAEDIRTAELVFQDDSNPQDIKEISIPEKMLVKGAMLDDKRLPVIIKVNEYFMNCKLAKIKDKNGLIASQGFGKGFELIEAPSVSGTDMGEGINRPGTFVTLIDRESKKEMGTYSFAQLLTDLEEIEEIKVGDKTWKAMLRFERVYKDYTVRLEDVRSDFYQGTNVVQNYSSDVRLVDSDRKVDDKFHIWMNNPLRYAGDTLYQQGYFRDPQTGKEQTTLQIVTNEGWMVPYVSCMIVAVGMLYHFVLTLMRFLNKQARLSNLNQQSVNQNSTEGEASVKTPVPWGSIIASTLIVVTVFGYLLSKSSMRPAKEGEMDLAKFGQIPVLYEGRIKPLDTLARNSLRMISNWESFPMDVPEKDQSSFSKWYANTFGDGKVTKKVPAIRWLADMIIDPQLAIDHKVIRIDDEELLKFLDLNKRKSHLYSINDIRMGKAAENNKAESEPVDNGNLEKLGKEADVARELRKNKKPITHRQQKVLELEQKIGVLSLLRRSFTPPSIESQDQKIINELAAIATDYTNLRRMNPPSLIPVDPAQKEWLPFSVVTTLEIINGIQAMSPQLKVFHDRMAESMTGYDAAKIARLDITRNPYTIGFSKICLEYIDGKAADFNKSVDEYLDLIKQDEANIVSTKWLKFEASFNNFSPFFYSGVIYLICFIMSAISWLVLPKTLGRSVQWIILLTFLVHTYAIVARIMISGRPPVTNLYSSAVFIGWAGVLAGIIIEWLSRKGIGNLLASVLGFATMWIAFGLSGEGETMKVLQAVLDTQFWLSTHVVCISLGYTATYVAGFLGIIYILQGIFTRSLTQENSDSLIRMIYGTVCFALFFSFVGTVLGGLWADDSWGRFWGWDPKENGALIIVIWNALVLHAYWDKLVRSTGLALLAIGGNLATSWSWFGVNQLGVGLHSYGFTEGVLYYLMMFALSQLVIILLGYFVPRSIWLSSKNLANK